MSLKDLKRDIASKCGVTVAEIDRRYGPLKVREARHLYFWEASEVRRPDGSKRYSTSQIGASAGGRDHSTIVSSLQRTRRLKRAEKLVAREAEHQAVGIAAE